MNAANVSGHEADQRSYSESEGDRKTREETANEISQSSKDPSSRMEKLPAMSRYGRAVKLKSPKTFDEDSRKTGTIPKLRRSSQLHQAVSREKDKIVEEHQAMSPKVEDEVLDDSQITEEKVLPKIKETPECNWLVGQLAWAHVGNYPYWPCVVTLDPTLHVHTKLRAISRTFVTLVHVHYFGDNGRHGWVSQNAMIPFIGLADFQKRAESANLEGKKRHALRFHVKPSIHTKWAIAVDEATELLPMSNAERGEHFTPKAESSIYEKLLELATSEGNNKRERLSDSAGPNPKRLKREAASPASETGEEVEKRKSHKVASDDDDKISINLNIETPPTPPSSHKDSSDESSVSRKATVKEHNKYLNDAFELYYERNRDMIEDTQPDATEDEIRTYLEKMWLNMNLTLRSKYHLMIEPDGNALSKGGSTDQEEESSVDSDSKEKDTKKTKVNKMEKDEIRVSDTIKKTRPYNLFRGTKQERVCQICERTGDLTRCKGPCFSYFHLSCVKPGESSSEYSMDEDTMDDVLFQDLKEIKRRSVTYPGDDDDKRDDVLDDKNFKCIDCLSGVAPACFICNDREEDRIRCSVLACGKHYHVSCLKTFPQAQLQGDRLTCPYHTCHTCSSNNPLNGSTRTANERLVRCVRCPSAYHASTSCVPAGSEILTGSQLVCPKHYKAPGPPVNATWCFLCTHGGSLICCDTCPTSFHVQCLGIDAPDGAFICEDCETGRMPLYGEVVWVKLGKYRWWPSRICFPHEIPQNLEAMSHSPGEFCVMFLGTNNYYWVHRGRAFLYQEGDANVKPSLSRKNVDEAYKIAVREANEIHERLKIQRDAAAKGSESRILKPPAYVKLKVNKPVGNVKPTEVESIVACDCDADWDNPCAPDTDCLNRILSVECSPDICPAGPKCNNQAFVRRQYPAMEPFHTAERGWGLRTLEPINDGQFVIEYVGEVIDETEYKRRLQQKKELKNDNFYFLTIDTCRMIDAEPKGNLSRFMNHSCQPNCETQKWTVNGDTRIGLFALRDIDVGEELTFNYNLASDGEEKKPCLCGAPNCSGFIGLKVQKQKTEVKQKETEVKRQRRSRRILKCCWKCGEILRKSDDYIECKQKKCLKRYHKYCVIPQDDESKFSCPWHYCAECSRRTGSHCTFCSTAYCQAHLDGNLKEYKDKGGYMCKLHEDMDSQKFLTEENEKEESDNETETDKECSSIILDSAPFTEKTALMPGEISPRVSIVEVQLSSEEGEDSQKEDSMNIMEYIDGADANEISLDSRKYSYERSSRRTRRQKEQIKTLRSLTPSELEIIIGGSIMNTNK